MRSTGHFPKVDTEELAMHQLLCSRYGGDEEATDEREKQDQGTKRLLGEKEDDIFNKQV